jgi:RimJ/RimL family protein N-acetyltransferase
MFARTKRLTLRPGWPEDAPALAQAIAHEPVAAMLARVPWPYGVADAEAFLAMPRGPHEPNFLIETMEHGAPRLVGGIELMRSGDAYELGYWLTPDAWGRGYATEAGHAVLHIARHGLGLRKLGFREVGRAARHSVARGRDMPCALLECALDADDDRPVMQIAA